LFDSFDPPLVPAIRVERILQGHARFQPRDAAIAVIAQHGFGSVETMWQEQFRILIKKPEIRGHIPMICFARPLIRRVRPIAERSPPNFFCHQA
jgi:hypothetical protein